MGRERVSGRSRAEVGAVGGPVHMILRRAQGPLLRRGSNPATVTAATAVTPRFEPRDCYDERRTPAGAAALGLDAQPEAVAARRR